MAKVQLADIVNSGTGPDIWQQYVIERTAELAAFGQSGIIGLDEEFNALAGGGGKTVNLPYWKDLQGTRQILSDSADLTPKKTTADKDVAIIHNDGDAWSVNVLAKYLSGDDPFAVIGDLVASYWGRQDELAIISLLKGVFAASPSDGTFPNYNFLKIASEDSTTITSATRLNGSTFIDGLLKLGDRQERITTVAMHSTTEAALRKLDLIDFVPDSEGKAMIKTFQGRRVVVDDTLPVRNGTTSGTNTVFTTFLFGPGAIAKGAASLSNPLEGGFGTEGVEFARSALGSDTHLINRRRYICHPRGVKWLGGTLTGVSPTNTEMEAANNWARVYEPKNVRVIAVVHNN